MICTLTLQRLYRNHEFNKVLTTASASRTLLKLAFDRSITSEVIKKIEIAATKGQKHFVTKHRGALDTTMELRLLHVHMYSLMTQHGLHGCKDTRRWLKVLSEKEIRTFAMTYFKFNAGRCEDPVSLVLDLVRFEGGTNWFDCSSVSYRLWNTKETHSASMNAEAVRPSFQKERGELSSEIVWHRPVPVPGFQLPDPFLLLGIYNEICGDRKQQPTYQITIPGTASPRQCKMFFTGVQKAFGNRDLKRSTVSTLIKALLVKTGAIPVNSPLQAMHTRHTCLSYVYFKCPDRIGEALLRSRHSKDTFLSTYNFRVAPGAQVVLTAFPADAQLEAIMMG